MSICREESMTGVNGVFIAGALLGEYRTYDNHRNQDVISISSPFCLVQNHTFLFLQEIVNSCILNKDFSVIIESLFLINL